MYGRSNLKHEILWTNGEVECPVIDCHELVKRQKEVFRRNPAFRCQDHRIYVSPTTFAYEDYESNWLRVDEDERDLWAKVKTEKRESRMDHDNSEDAVTWNSLRYLEREGLLKNLFAHLELKSDAQDEVIYWSYSPRENRACQWLIDARAEFGEVRGRDSEPDVILRNPTSLVFVEAKLTATNRTDPSNPSVTKDYLTGGQNWFRTVFSSSYEEVALRDRLYELMRFWLLGSWIADREGLAFRLVNLVRDGQETDISERFGRHTISTPDRMFIRVVWEDLFRLSSSASVDASDNLLESYAMEKTLGYDASTRQLLLAFTM